MAGQMPVRSSRYADATRTSAAPTPALVGAQRSLALSRPIAHPERTADSSMMDSPENWSMSRRRLLQIGALATAGSFGGRATAWADERRATGPLAEFGYGAVSMASDAHEAQLRNTQSVLMSLSDDSLL